MTKNIQIRALFCTLEIELKRNILLFNNSMRRNSRLDFRDLNSISIELHIQFSADRVLFLVFDLHVYIHHWLVQESIYVVLIRDSSLRFFPTKKSKRSSLEFSLEKQTNFRDYNRLFIFKSLNLSLSKIQFCFFLFDKTN